ncbi:Alstrom syndrome protein 1 homolog isoform X1 [Etheostoma spectabile]|uniref:Alstrom syndrome protein 1 homolog isoform X1 n=1 Tax=Etheostoma spectabile TaxID=54343 RepID=UPI0013AF2098|nr:Alstrom syndrome protein 1 isoform X1 [Etheostoma spectabile]
MEPAERVVESPQMPGEEDASQAVGHASMDQLEAKSPSTASQDQRQPTLETHGWELQQGRSFQQEFQDSNLSPALSLMPVNFNEYSLFQQSDNEFAPLRAFPDISMASERFHVPPQDRTTQASECGSLSQHPLAQATILSEDEVSSCCSLSQYSLSLINEGRREETVQSPMIATTDRQGVPSRDDTGIREKDLVTLTDPPDKPVGEADEDEAFFLSKNIPAQHLLDLLQKDIGMASSSSAFSSASKTSVTSSASFSGESKSTQVCKPGIDQSMVKREGPPGEVSLSQQHTQPDRDLYPDPLQTLSSVCNITMGSRSTKPDDSSELLHRELLSEVERRSSREAESKNRQRKSPTPPGQSLKQYTTAMPEGKPSVTRTNLCGLQLTGPFSAGVERGHREQDLWFSGNQTGIDGSYLGFLPQSQSTPGFFKAPPKSSVKAKLGQLSDIESHKESSYQSNTEIFPQPAAPLADVHRPDIENQSQEEATSPKVQSLPSLNYMQKVDAWRANQSSGNTSLFDSLALQGFSGISPKKKAYDAVSDSLNHILSQQVKSLQQPVSSAANPNVTQSSSTAPSGSPTRRGEAVGGAPIDKDNTGSATRPSASTFGRSQSQSSLSTIGRSVQEDQQKRHGEKGNSQTQDNGHHQPNVTVQPLPHVSLSQFSDVSLDHNLTLSSSQNSYNSGIKLGASIGASSVVSLEVDNYAPYWTSKQSTPPPLPKPRELNIEERIPLYLHNLGIDQSPSTILTPFVPRGPIREPEFSPTDLCTIKGSTGTPTKSTQISEGGSPNKGQFSRSSILSVDSSISIPLSLDSLRPGATAPERTTCAFPSSDTEAIQSKHRQSPSSLPEKDTYQSTQHQHRDSCLTGSKHTIKLVDCFGSDPSLATRARCGERDVDSPLQTSRSLEEQSAEDSMLSSKALLEIRQLLSQAGNVLSAGSSGGFSASTAPSSLPADDIFLSLKKKTRKLQDSLFSCANEDLKTRTSLLCARSSSDSMLTSENVRKSSIGRESMTSSQQHNYSFTQALVPAPAKGAHRRPQESTASRGAESALVLSQSARRAEPEGCSAAPPDNTVPPQPSLIAPLPVLSTETFTSTPTDIVGVTEEEKQTIPEGPLQSSLSLTILEDADQEVMSDGSSECSLAVRVAKLLQSESPATVVSSTPSITDQEESKAREWIKLKLSGQQCEPLELDKEDRKRIEEIKRELLLKYPMKSQGSTDTESSTASSIRVQMVQDASWQSPLLKAVNVNNQPSQPLPGLHTDLLDSSVQLKKKPRPDLETQICEIAAREGVTLPKKNPQALTSITIATRRRSTSSSPSTSPAPPLSPAPGLLHLAELSTEPVEAPIANRQLSHTTAEEDEATRKLASAFEPSSSRNQNLTSTSAPVNQKRQDAIGGQFEESAPPSQGLGREDVNAMNTQSFMGDELSVQNSSCSGVGHKAEKATGSSTSESPASTGHVSHVHLTLSPKATDHTSSPAVHPSHAVTGLLRKEFPPLRHTPSAACSPDEGVGLSSPPEWYDVREPIRHQVPKRPETSTLFTTTVPQGTMTLTSTQSSAPCHRVVVSQRNLTTETPAVPVLLPYKPCGSEELFYIPQRETDISSTSHSDTTMESSHTGSDDAVPPRFGSEVLGHRDTGLDRGVTIRHSEGIYSKRLKTATFKMHESGHRGASVSADGPSQTSVTQAPKQSYQVSAAFTRVSLSSNQEVSKRDQGTSPMQFPSYDQPKPSRVRFHVDLAYDKASHHLDQSPATQAGEERNQEKRYSGLHHPTSKQSSSTLDQLWKRFCDQWSLEQSQPTSDREASLLERLERLSRLINNSRGTYMSELQQENLRRRGEDAMGNKTQKDGVVKRSVGCEARGIEWKVRGRKVEGEPPVPHQTWTQSLQVDETSEPTDEDNRDSSISSFSQGSSQSQHLCPADRDESETLSTMSSSMSTVDTARLIRAFGAHRVQHLKTSSSLSKLYSTINKQKEGREQWRGRNKEPPYIITLSETTGTDESIVAADSASTSTYTLPSHSGPSRTLAAKKSVKLVSRSIQAGDLEIVLNGTRRHTRDVGTTFPSPGEARTSRQISSISSSLEKGRGGRKSPAKSQGLQKQGKSKRSLPKTYPKGVSWFISADNLRSEVRKENQPEEDELLWRQSTAWFEPYSRINPWREPLRQRQVHEDRYEHDEPHLDPITKTMSSGLTRISLQEALEMHRPEFISESRQRVKRMALQAQERKLQANFCRERDELFSWLGGPRRPAGTALLRRAVPRKEMILRSKQIYENLPEVQRRREEERRKAEYRSYRLNAHLYNKRITNHVLGRRTAWQ